MGKISVEAKKRYFERITEYKNVIEDIQRREKSLILVIQTDETGAEYKKLILADEVLNRVSFYVLMNELSMVLLGIKNENYLNDARKDIYKSLIYLEEVVTNYIDVPFSDYEKNLENIEGFGEDKRYLLIQKLGYSIQALEESFGENSKWRWSFVELEGRYATIAKNFINLKTFVGGMDPRVDGYEIRMAHIILVKRILQQSADRYREKYELSTKRLDDFKLAISYLAALKRLHMILGEMDEIDVIKKKIDVWKARLEDDLRTKEKNSKS
ncbi:MAG: hypothetical protein E4H36_05725 [Spirochaetales bacterium]|nr:MAG: hypothetical protein E4H36_05725 [Spirochaetales bacterium]